MTFDKHDYAKMHIAGTLPVSHLPAHATTHEPAGSDPLAVDAAASVGSLRTVGAGALQAAPGDHSHGTGARPVMAQDPGDSRWYVVVDSSGTAVIAEG